MFVFSEFFISIQAIRSACNMDIETRMGRTIFESEKYKYRLRFILSDGQSRVRISNFYSYKDDWIPGKAHFFMSLE